MKKGIVYLSALLMAFTVLFVPVEVQASELTATDVKHKAYSMGLSNFAVTYYNNNDVWVVFEKPYRHLANLNGENLYKVVDGVLVDYESENNRIGHQYLTIHYSTHDIISQGSNDVFFSASLDPIPRALAEVVPSLLAQALKILPVAVAILAVMMGVSLISRVLYRYL